MESDFDVLIGPGGTIEMLYQEGIEEFAAEIGADIAKIQRLTNVEWDEKVKGWVVRAAHNPFFALRYVIKDGSARVEPRMEINAEREIAVFTTRDAAIEAEKKFATMFMEERHAFLKNSSKAKED
jgi:hypothetical protein